MKEITMPSFGSDMEQGVLTEWLVKVGDTVKRGDPIAVIETNKGAIELDAYDEGCISELLIKVGQKTPVGQPIAQLSQLNDEADLAVISAQRSATKLNDLPGSSVANKGKQAASQSPCQPLGSASGGKTSVFYPASPAARELAQQHNMPLSAVAGSGPDGAIRLVDVQAALVEKPKPTPSRSGFDPQQMRDAIAATVTRSKQQIPHYYLSHTLDITLLEQHLSLLNGEREPLQRILLIAPLLRVIARSLVKYPQLNGHYLQRFAPSETIDIANAVNLRGGGLVMPVLRDVDHLSVDGLMQQLQALVERAKQGTLKFSDLDAPSFTVSNIGDRGVEAMWGVIYPPQVAIVGLGCPREAVVVEQGKVVIRRVMTVTLSADHRVTDGHYGSRFLTELNKRLQKPEALWNA
ncbi:2-oxo acid dehydrogenase subunit E2 [Corallincola luteus]|uniref:Dihydrolipoamide acetyltransferase component of pyruvate dehydrogenase complex n=1 Tax=Corallincola luteus TaxID=1775177 RepID=A0ABY2AL75_9GAMM|nr:dihydrolipoamide acetyltransferase family protein [Corallincola luteus]TCI01994.1 2-oxo acid dehydrogenase subunit E2 [Corallincola luteus]